MATLRVKGLFKREASMGRVGQDRRACLIETATQPGFDLVVLIRRVKTSAGRRTALSPRRWTLRRAKRILQTSLCAVAALGKQTRSPAHAKSRVSHRRTS